MKGVLRQFPAENGSYTARLYMRPDIGLCVFTGQGAQPGPAPHLLSWLEGSSDAKPPESMSTNGDMPDAYRCTIIARESEEVVQRLRAVSHWSRNTLDRGVASAAFMFTGQGSQHPEMGHDLYLRSALFKHVFDRCCDLFEPLLEKDLRDLLWRSGCEEELDNTLNAQPAIFTLGYSLAQLWLYLGVRPSHLIGHSVGELTAACIAGMLSLPDAVKLVAQRALHMGRIPSGGAMAVIKADAEYVERRIHERASAVNTAAINGKKNVVISGEKAAVEELMTNFEEAGISCQRLAVSHAFHSRLMDPILGPFESAIWNLSIAPPAIPTLSNVTGGFHPTGVAPDHGYWRSHIRSPVLFAANLEAAAQDGCVCYMELGARPVLARIARRQLRGRKVKILSPLGSADAPVRELAEALELLHDIGHAIEWDRALDHLAEFLKAPVDG